MLGGSGLQKGWGLSDFKLQGEVPVKISYKKLPTYTDIAFHYGGGECKAGRLTHPYSPYSPGWQKMSLQ